MPTIEHLHTDRCFWDPSQARWACRPAPADPAAPALTEVIDVRDMIVVHTAMLREFRLAPAAVARTGPGETRRAARVAGHLEFLGALLHHHHEGEDELLWPKLRARTPEPARALLDEAEAQHRGLDVALEAVAGARVAWVAAPGAGPRATLVEALTTLHARLEEHLDLEERALLPLAAAALTGPEWHAIGEAAVAAMPKPALVLAFGMFAYEGDPAVLRAMLRSAPALPRLLLPRIAPRVYARRAARIHGTRRP